MPNSVAPKLSLHHFAFPFSGKSWTFVPRGRKRVDSLWCVGKGYRTRSLRKSDGGVTLGRFDQLAEAASTLVANSPAICVFLKPRLSGPRYLKELQDRVVITWDATEPFGSLLDFTWFKTINRFQAVLNLDGVHRDVLQGTVREGRYRWRLSEFLTWRKACAGSLFFSHAEGWPFASMYESFHYMAVPKPQDLSCTIIKTLGDKFDFLVYYSDFRIDSQEASSPSDGPIGGNVTGIGQTQHDQTQQSLRAAARKADSNWGSLSRCLLARTKCRKSLRREHPSAAATT